MFVLLYDFLFSKKLSYWATIFFKLKSLWVLRILWIWNVWKMRSMYIFCTRESHFVFESTGQLSFANQNSIGCLKIFQETVIIHSPSEFWMILISVLINEIEN